MKIQATIVVSRTIEIEVPDGSTIEYMRASLIAEASTYEPEHSTIYWCSEAALIDYIQ